MIKNIFDKQVAENIINRIEQLNTSTKPNWGKMNAEQMIAHCNVTYQYVYEQERFNKPNAFKKFLLKTFIKGIVVNEKPYPKSSRTAPEFVMTGKKDFEKEKSILIDNINKTQKLGANHFEGLENISFGKMTSKEWNNMFYKHLNHHLTQFGV